MVNNISSTLDKKSPADSSSKPRRPRGRPRKHPLPLTKTNEATKATVPPDYTQPKCLYVFVETLRWLRTHQKKEYERLSRPYACRLLPSIHSSLSFLSNPAPDATKDFFDNAVKARVVTLERRLFKAGLEMQRILPKLPGHGRKPNPMSDPRARARARARAKAKAQREMEELARRGPPTSCVIGLNPDPFYVELSPVYFEKEYECKCLKSLILKNSMKVDNAGEGKGGEGMCLTISDNC